MRSIVTRTIAFAAVAAVLTVSAQAQQQPGMRPPVGGVASPKDAMIFFMAHGPADSCGKGCADWAVAEGSVQWDTHKRLFAFVDRHPGLKLPVAVDTWGDANLDVAASLGRIIRDRGLSTTVGMTYPQICARETESACFELKRTASTPLNSELHVTRLHCDLACLLILSGGVRRTIPRDTKLKISGTEIFNRFGASVSEQRREGLTTFYSDRTRRYFAEMGIDPEIMDMLKRANDSPRAIELPASEWTRLRLVTDAAP